MDVDEQLMLVIGGYEEIRSEQSKLARVTQRVEQTDESGICRTRMTEVPAQTSGYCDQLVRSASTTLENGMLGVSEKSNVSSISVTIGRL